VVNLKLKAVILDVIHSLDVVEQMQRAGVRHRTDWFWHKQLRYYVEGGACVVRMCDAQNAYSYEYQGNDAKLVHTPLTDKCYLTLTQVRCRPGPHLPAPLPTAPQQRRAAPLTATRPQGLHLGYGGNPYGPAGTGKTESVKALGQALARQVLVFNCDEGIDYKSMGRIFTGLVKCGAWGCFDEFNRLEAEAHPRSRGNGSTAHAGMAPGAESPKETDPVPAPPHRTLNLRLAAPPPPPPPSRTDWTRLVPPPVLTGHVSSTAES
jgi:dynein heavy chain 2